MARPSFQLSVGEFDTFCATFTAAATTTGRLLHEPYQARAMAGTLPELAGGGSLVELLASNSHASTAAVFQLYRGKLLSDLTAANAGAVTITASGNNVIARTVGSWLTDGWKVGKQLMLFAKAGNTPQSVEGVIGTVTGVTATQLTLNGTPLAALTVDADTRIFEVAQLFQASVPATAGFAAAATNVLSVANNTSANRNDVKLGRTESLIAACVSTLPALPATAGLTGQVGRY